LKLSQVGIHRAMETNARIADPMAARLYSIMSLAAEKLGVLNQVRGTLLQLHRAAVLRHDAIGQETLLNLLLRNYLAYKMYNQAEALRAKAQPEVYRSSAQHCRLLYYHGRIQAVLLEYSDAKEALVQASRKAPQSARGFRLQVAKWLVVVRLLLGEVPNRSELAPADLRSMMAPYYDLARAVGRGDVAMFNAVAETHKEEFERDNLRHVVARLSANVLRSGVRRIASAYCRISLKDIAKKLGLTNVSDAEYIVAKAIRDGGIVAQLDHETGIMTCPSVSDVYSTDEPLNAFHARIAFCLDVRNEAVTAIRHDPIAKTSWNDSDGKEGESMSIQDALDAFFDE
jgi:26S proteasome regulatory subunit N3